MSFELGFELNWVLNWIGLIQFRHHQKNLSTRRVHNFCSKRSFFKRKNALESWEWGLSNAFFLLKNYLLEQKLWTLLVDRFFGVKRNRRLEIPELNWIILNWIELFWIELNYYELNWIIMNWIELDPNFEEFELNWIGLGFSAVWIELN